MPTTTELRALARALEARAAALDDDGMPEFARAMLARCREDLAVILASTEPEIEALLRDVDIESFEQLRGLLKAQ